MSAGYDGAGGVLELEFRGGRVYRYSGVPEGVYAWLLRTPNKGAYVQRMIADRYPYEAVAGRQDPAGPSQAGPSLLEALQASLDRTHAEGEDRG